MLSENKKLFNLLGVIFFLCLFLAGFTGVVGAQTQDSEVLETEINLDQMVTSAPSQKSSVSAVQPPAITVSAGSAAANKPAAFEEEQLMMLNENLKNIIEENKQLVQQNKAMAEELRLLRGSSEITASRVNFLTSQREDLQKRIAQIESQSNEYKQQIDRLNNAVAEKEKEFEQKLIAIDEESKRQEKRDDEAVAGILNFEKGKEAAQDSALLREKAKATLDKFESNTQKIVSRVGGLQRENKKLKVDSSRLHYNLANTFFEQGKYEMAASEYRKVLEFMPQDAEAHYNLAFVSGEFLSDFGAALEHYQQYLYLNPYAEDAPLVKEKILHAQLELRGKIDSHIDKSK